MGRIGRFLVLSVAVAGLAAPAAAREALGIFGSWGAFRDVRPLRCFAIAEPPSVFQDAKFRPFASVATWPGRNARGQLHIRLRKAKLLGAPITLSVGDRRFPLVGGAADAWAPDARADAAIVAAIRSGTSMSISTRAENGRAFADAYGLRGAATAIDAAALGCARIR
jgi:hypothetical protein